ncbi:YiiX/YebB-like N1pC/P60 family cysteine hydrolase [Alistipes sp.]|uniref:YiiX/YebB-like N1pC/P60 family cysteine hydrolase n=1 Tax=Alistipes sp. TaxID=1872444 RepID=UPI003AF1C2A2
MRTLLYIGILFSAISCTRTEPELRPGDLLFQAGRHSDMSSAITAATGRNGELNFSHVGIAAGSPRADSVIEATTEGGVRIIALDEFLARAVRIEGRPGVAVMRLRDTTGATEAVARARTFLGQPYDYSFRPANGRMYCSELVWESFLAPDGSHLFEARPMNFGAPDGTMPAFWTELFAKAGEEIPQGVPGTNPNDMAREPILEPAGRYF